MQEKKTEASGYLHQNFRLFHLKDKKNIEFPFHYHDFNKIIIFLSGNVTYFIEGTAYFLKPFDILLVGRHDIHKAIIDAGSTYERIVIWIDNDFIKSGQIAQHAADKQPAPAGQHATGNQPASAGQHATGNQPATAGQHAIDKQPATAAQYAIDQQPATAVQPQQSDISKCFEDASRRSRNLIRLDPGLQNKIRDILYSLEHSLKSEEYGSDILSHTYFLQLMVYINRIFADSNYRLEDSAAKSNRQMDAIFSYIHENLSADLNVSSLAKHFYLSPSYLMHKFKASTGYTLHQYITQKRLLSACKLIQAGVPAMKAAAQCGFCDYSSFSRAFKKMFGCPPRDYF